MDYSITILFVLSVLVSALFIAIACRSVFALFLKKDNEFYIIQKKNRHLTPFTNELLEKNEHLMEHEMSREEEFKKAA